MGANNTYLFFYTRQQEDIYDPSRYQQLVNGLVALQLYVALPGEETDQKALTAPGASSIVQKDVQDAQGTSHAAWVLQVYSLDPGEPFGGFTFHLGNDELDETDEAYGALEITYDTSLFDESTNGVTLYDHFLEALRLVYEVYRPVYAYQFDPRDGRDVTTLEEAQSAQIHTLYDVNFFAPELVEKLGRERIESAPAERVVALDDGGVLLLPRIFFSPDAYAYHLKDVADHLGLLPPPD